VWKRPIKEADCPPGKRKNKYTLWWVNKAGKKTAIGGSVKQRRTTQKGRGGEVAKKRDPRVPGGGFGRIMTSAAKWALLRWKAQHQTRKRALWRKKVASSTCHKKSSGGWVQGETTAEQAHGGKEKRLGGKG